MKRIQKLENEMNLEMAQNSYGLLLIRESAKDEQKCRQETWRWPKSFEMDRVMVKSLGYGMSSYLAMVKSLELYVEMVKRDNIQMIMKNGVVGDEDDTTGTWAESTVGELL